MLDFLSTASRIARQRQIVLLAGILGGFSTLLYTAIFAALDLAQLKPLIIATTAFSVVWLLTPLVQRVQPAAAFFYFVITFGIGETVFNIIGGSAVSGHYFYLVAPALIVMAIGPRRRVLSSVLVIFFVSLFIYSELQIPAEGLLSDASPSAALISFVFCVAMASFINLGISTIAFTRLEETEDALNKEFMRSETLLHNLLPLKIVEQLKRHPDATIAFEIPKASVLFADIVGFTPLTEKLDPEDLVKLLNKLFSSFDRLCEKHNVEKIKTIGDAYMVAGGISGDQAGAAMSVARMALEMHEEARRLSNEEIAIELRIGVHSGPVIAGVIGTKKPFFDIWGDTVNTAARMESHGSAGKIQVTEAAKEAIGNSFSFAEDHNCEIKGKGIMRLSYLIGENASDVTRSISPR